MELNTIYLLALVIIVAIGICSIRSSNCSRKDSAKDPTDMG